MPLRHFAKFFNGVRKSTGFWTKPCNFHPQAGKLIVSGEHNFGGHTWSRHQQGSFQWVFLSSQAAIILGSSSMISLSEDVPIESSSDNGKSLLDKIAEDALISNEHTSKWRIFTDSGRDYFMQGNIKQAEKFFSSALQEAKEGFGERDPHVASSCNNLAELYRVKKDYESAEPLYVEAITILEEYYGTNDIRVGAALHNLGQFYFVQRKLEKARECYERALKIKRRVLGELHTEYADTMYHLGTVLYLQGKEKDSQDHIAESIQILEAGELGDSRLCVRRMQYLAQMYMKSNRFAEAELLLRKVLHVLEVSKGWESLDTVVAAERLALANQTAGKLREAEELLERCLDARKSLLPADHIQNAANELFIARVKIRIAEQIMTFDSSQAMTKLDMAKNLLDNSVRVARRNLIRSVEQKKKKEPIDPPRRTVKENAMLILLQSLNALGSLEGLNLELHNSKKQKISAKAGAALRQCISTYKEFESVREISDSLQVKSEYLSCLKLLHNLMSRGIEGTAKEIEDEIQRVKGDLSKAEKV